jgi:hypothetical protein
MKIKGKVVEIGSLESGHGDGYTVQSDDGLVIEITGIPRDVLQNNNFLFDDVVITFERKEA